MKVLQTMVVVSVLGSCRLAAVNKHYETTALQELLTYPHYGKEVIQAIEYIHHHNIPQDLARKVFRTGILGGGIDYPATRREYDRTDVFLMEIASFITYSYNGYYYNGLAVEEQYHCPDRECIRMGTSSREEIATEIQTIQKLLLPKKLILVTHFSTYTSGKRYDLACLIEQIGRDLQIPVVNPSVLLVNYSVDDLFIPEALLSHYTPLGHTLVAQLYQQAIVLL